MIALSSYDIFIKTPNTDNLLQPKIIFLREFEKKFAEQKVDLIIESANSKPNKIFEIAKQEGTSKINICLINNLLPITPIVARKLLRFYASKSAR